MNDFSKSDPSRQASTIEFEMRSILVATASAKPQRNAPISSTSGGDLAADDLAFLGEGQPSP
jgi:hypothetical protein